MIGKAAFQAGVTLAIIATAAAPALAQVTTTAQTTAVTQSAPAVVQTAPAVIQTAPVVTQTCPAVIQAAPACINSTVTLPAVLPAVPVIPVAVPTPACVKSYLPHNYDSSQDFIWEPFGPEADTIPTVGPGGG